MAKKPTVTTLQSGFNSTETLNANFEALRDGFDNTLSLDGSTPNAMEADLDLNGNNIIGATGLLINGTDYLGSVEAAKTAAQAAQAAAETAETNAETAETNAKSSETAAGLSATAAATSATASQTAQTGAELAETNAETAESNAATSATNAATSATNAATSETNASTSASTASTKASEAATSATNAATSATEAETAKTGAETARDSALAALDSFDDRYLGVKTSDPTVDNDGDALVVGAIYYNSNTGFLYVYNGTTWQVTANAASGDLVSTNNLSDLTSPATARTNLGLGTAATTASTDYATAAQGALADSAVQPDDNVSLGTVTADGLTVDTNTLYVDATGNKVGIGTNSPRADLSVYRGTATDDFNLIVTTFRPNIVLEDMSTNASDWQLFADGGDLQFRYGDASTDTKLANEAMRIDNSGNVGIGEPNPATALDVNGTVTATSYAGNGSALTGVLSKGADIGGSVDLNTYTTDGYYHQNNNSNATSGTNYPVALAGMLTVMADGNMVYQKYQTYNGSGAYQRTKYNSTWYAWDKIFDSGNDGSGSGLDADTVDGVHESTFMRKSANSDLDMNGNDIIDVGDIRTSSGTKVFFPRAWVNFNGQSTVSIRDSGNVSTITDLGTGNFRINFTSPYSNASYAMSGSGANTVASSDTFSNAYSFATSSVTVGVNTMDGDLVDRIYNTVTTVGNQ